MANTYDPASVGVKAPAGGFQEGGWYGGRQYWGGTLSDPGVIHPSSNQQGAGQAVSAEVNAQSAAKQGVSAPQLESYLEQQRKAQAAMKPTPVASTATPRSGGTSGGTGADISGLAGGMGAMQVPAIDLAATYKRLTQESGINEVQAELDTKKKAYNEAVAKINDNPYYSEATRVGRAEKLRSIYENEATRLESGIATKKADIDMLLNLETKQFDINSQAAQLALSQFNSLLEMGALDSAAPEDLANITRSTGLSSALIQSAIQAKKVAGYETTSKTFDDGVNEGFVIYTVDKMGNIVNQVKQITGTSSKAKTQYSTDPFVSSFIQSILKENVNSSPGSMDELWNTTPATPKKTTSQSNQTFSYQA